MVCQTIKEGMECIYMKKEGCTYNGGKCHPIVEECQGCSRVTEFPTGLYCATYSEPQVKWNNGSMCTLANHLKKAATNGNGKKVNPLKASKRSSAGR